MALAVLAYPVHASESDAIGSFEIARFEVRGNTLLPGQEVERVVTPFTGRERNFGHVQMALEALEAAYQRRGFNVVQVALPEQELNQGVVVFQVVEAKLEAVRIEGNKTFSEANIRRSMPGLVEGQTPNIGETSASLRLANENPAKKTTLQLQRGKEDGEIAAVIKVADDKPWQLSTTLDNTGNSSIGKTRMTVQYQHANVADRDHVASVQYSTTVEKPDQVAAYGLGYHIPLYGMGDSIDLFASYSNADFNLGGTNLQVTGKGTMFGGRYNHNLKRVGEYASKLTYGIDHKAFRSTLQGIQFGDVTVHPVSLAYAGNWSMSSAEAGFSVTAIRNISGGSRGRRADFNGARTGAEPDYRIVRYTAAYSRMLPQDWQMRVGLSGQFTPDALIPGEQFGIGGATTVRGFDERDVASDKGHLFNAEIYTPNFCAAVQSVAMQCRAVGFYDAARVKSSSPQPGDVARASIASVGLGLRVIVDRYMTLQMDYGHVVDAGLARRKGDERLHIRLGLTY